MLGRRISRTGLDRRADRARRGPQRVCRPCVESLEGRQVLSAIAEFPLPASYGYPFPPFSLTAGPDGNLWFTGSAINRITPTGNLAAFPLPAGDFPPSSLPAGPDGNVWFTDSTLSGSVIARITPAGNLAAFPPTPGYFPSSSLTAGPDGN